CLACQPPVCGKSGRAAELFLSGGGRGPYRGGVDPGRQRLGHRQAEAPAGAGGFDRKRRPGGGGPAPGQRPQRNGISATLTKLEWDSYISALEKGDFDLYLGEVRLTADFDLPPLIPAGGALNYGGYSDTETAQLLQTYRAASGQGRD